MRFTILGSSSSGNCALLVTEGCTVLVDAGFSARRIKGMLDGVGMSVDEIDAVFITHEHSDHCAGLNGLCRGRDLKVFANRGTATVLHRSLRNKPDWQIFETGTSFQFRGLEVESFQVPHDATEPVGFVFSHGYGDLISPRQSVAWVTDLGYAPELVRQRIREVDILVLEANHDLGLLKNDRKRPWSVKQRISGRHGHLSNEAARDLMASIEQPAWQHVCLAHLSRDCNSLDSVEETFAEFRGGDARFALSVVSPEAGGPDLQL